MQPFLATSHLESVGEASQRMAVLAGNPQTAMNGIFYVGFKNSGGWASNIGLEQKS